MYCVALVRVLNQEELRVNDLVQEDVCYASAILGNRLRGSLIEQIVWSDGGGLLVSTLVELGQHGDRRALDNFEADPQISNLYFCRLLLPGTVSLFFVVIGATVRLRVAQKLALQAKQKIVLSFKCVVL